MSSPLSRETQADLLRLIEWVEVSGEKPDLVAFLRHIADSTEGEAGWLRLLKDWCAKEAEATTGERRETFQRVEQRLATLTAGPPTQEDIDWATAAVSPADSTEQVEGDGAALIAAERRRQIEKEGRTADHDDRWNHRDQLARAAACYAMPEPIYVRRERPGPPDEVAYVSPWPTTVNASDRGHALINWRRPEADRITQLVRAGALIAAEIDRLQRLEVNDE